MRIDLLFEAYALVMHASDLVVTLFLWLFLKAY